MKHDLVERLRTRAAIRKKLREVGEVDRIGEVLEEAADAIEELEYELNNKE